MRNFIKNHKFSVTVGAIVLIMELTLLTGGSIGLFSSNSGFIGLLSLPIFVNPASFVLMLLVDDIPILGPILFVLSPFLFWFLSALLLERMFTIKIKPSDSILISIFALVALIIFIQYLVSFIGGFS